MMDQDEYGYRLDAFGGSVCGRCVDDYALAALVEANAVDRHCDYCDAQADVPIALDVDEVLKHFGRSIATEYSDPLQEMGRDEDGYVGAPTYDIGDVLDDEGWEGEPKFRELIMHAFSDELYCQRNPYAISESEALHLGWREFVETVTHRARFTFTIGNPTHDDGAGYPVLRGGEMLANLSTLIGEHGLTRDLPAGERWLRVRSVAKTHSDYTTVRDLGSPPSQKAKPNRMSPAGIPMFYGSDDENTAINETRAAATDPDPDFIVAEFVTTEAGMVIDLTDIPPPPSLFDDEQRHQRAALSFLNGFARDVSKPLSAEDEQQVDYVPTQVVCEYLRHHHVSPGSGRPVGLLFRSAKNEVATNVVYFVGPEDCLDPGRAAANGSFQLRLDSARRRRF